MIPEYWQIVSDVEQYIANGHTDHALAKIEHLLREYGDTGHTLYLKGVCLEQQNSLIVNSKDLHLVSMQLLEGQDSTVAHLDKVFQWLYLTEDWDHCCKALDLLLAQESIPTSISPGKYFKLAGPIRRSLIRQLLDAERLSSTMTLHPFIIELKVLFQNAPQGSNDQRNTGDLIVLLISDESIGDHFDAIQDQFRQLNHPVILVSGDVKASTSTKSETDLRSWLDEVNPRAVFIQTPYLETLPKLWQQSITSQRFCIPGYGPNLSGDDFWWGGSRGQFGLSGHVLARHVFAESASTVQSFYDCGLSPAQVILTGDPLSWSMRRNFRSIDASINFDLLWAPHWAPFNLSGSRRGYRNIERDTKLVLQIADAGQTVCLRAHPLLARRMEQDPEFITANSKSHDESLARTWEQLISHRNVTVSSATMVEDCLRCNRLLTDGISIIFYWSLTGKPIAISSRHDSPAFAKFATPLLDEIPKLLTEAEILDWLEGSGEPNYQLLIERCNEIIPDNRKSPMEIFLEFS